MDCPDSGQARKTEERETPQEIRAGWVAEQIAQFSKRFWKKPAESEGRTRSQGPHFKACQSKSSELLLRKSEHAFDKSKEQHNSLRHLFINHKALQTECEKVGLKSMQRSLSEQASFEDVACSDDATISKESLASSSPSSNEDLPTSDSMPQSEDEMSHLKLSLQEAIRKVNKKCEKFDMIRRLATEVNSAKPDQASFLLFDILSQRQRGGLDFGKKKKGKTENDKPPVAEEKAKNSKKENKKSGGKCKKSPKDKDKTKDKTASSDQESKKDDSKKPWGFGKKKNKVQETKSLEPKDVHSAASDNAAGKTESKLSPKPADQSGSPQKPLISKSDTVLSENEEKQLSSKRSTVSFLEPPTEEKSSSEANREEKPDSGKGKASPVKVENRERFDAMVEHFRDTCKALEEIENRCKETNAKRKRASSGSCMKKPTKDAECQKLALKMRERKTRCKTNRKQVYATPSGSSDYSSDNSSEAAVRKRSTKSLPDRDPKEKRDYRKAKSERSKSQGSKGEKTQRKPSVDNGGLRNWEACETEVYVQYLTRCKEMQEELRRLEAEKQRQAKCAKQLKELRSRSASNERRSKDKEEAESERKSRSRSRDRDNGKKCCKNKNKRDASPESSKAAAKKTKAEDTEDKKKSGKRWCGSKQKPSKTKIDTEISSDQEVEDKKKSGIRWCGSRKKPSQTKNDTGKSSDQESEGKKKSGKRWCDPKKKPSQTKSYTEKSSDQESCASSRSRLSKEWSKNDNCKRSYSSQSDRIECIDGSCNRSSREREKSYSDSTSTSQGRRRVSRRKYSRARLNANCTPLNNPERLCEERRLRVCETREKYKLLAKQQLLKHNEEKAKRERREWRRQLKEQQNLINSLRKCLCDAVSTMHEKYDALEALTVGNETDSKTLEPSEAKDSGQGNLYQPDDGYNAPQNIEVINVLVKGQNPQGSPRISGDSSKKSDPRGTESLQRMSEAVLGMSFFQDNDVRKQNYPHSGETQIRPGSASSNHAFKDPVNYFQQSTTSESNVRDNMPRQHFLEDHPRDFTSREKAQEGGAEAININDRFRKSARPESASLQNEATSKRSSQGSRQVSFDAPDMYQNIKILKSPAAAFSPSSAKESILRKIDLQAMTSKIPNPTLRNSNLGSQSSEHTRDDATNEKASARREAFICPCCSTIRSICGECRDQHRLYSLSCMKNKWAPHCDSCSCPRRLNYISRSSWRKIQKLARPSTNPKPLPTEFILDTYRLCEDQEIARCRTLKRQQELYNWMRSEGKRKSCKTRVKAKLKSHCKTSSAPSFPSLNALKTGKQKEGKYVSETHLARYCQEGRPLDAIHEYAMSSESAKNAINRSISRRGSRHRPSADENSTDLDARSAAGKDDGQLKSPEPFRPHFVCEPIETGWSIGSGRQMYECKQCTAEGRCEETRRLLINVCYEGCQQEQADELKETAGNNASSKYGSPTERWLASRRSDQPSPSSCSALRLLGKVCQKTASTVGLDSYPIGADSAVIDNCTLACRAQCERDNRRHLSSKAKRTRSKRHRRRRSTYCTEEEITPEDSQCESLNSSEQTSSVRDMYCEGAEYSSTENCSPSEGDSCLDFSCSDDEAVSMSGGPQSESREDVVTLGKKRPKTQPSSPRADECQSRDSSCQDRRSGSKTSSRGQPPAISFKEQRLRSQDSINKVSSKKSGQDFRPRSRTTSRGDKKTPAESLPSRDVTPRRGALLQNTSSRAPPSTMIPRRGDNAKSPANDLRNLRDKSDKSGTCHTYASNAGERKSSLPKHDVYFPKDDPRMVTAKIKYPSPTAVCFGPRRTPLIAPRHRTFSSSTAAPLNLRVRPANCADCSNQQCPFKGIDDRLNGSGAGSFLHLLENNEASPIDHGTRLQGSGGDGFGKLHSPQEFNNLHSSFFQGAPQQFSEYDVNVGSNFQKPSQSVQFNLHA